MGLSKESNFINKTISESIVRPTSKPLKINEVPRTNFKLDSKGDFGGQESGSAFIAQGNTETEEKILLQTYKQSLPPNK